MFKAQSQTLYRVATHDMRHSNNRETIMTAQIINFAEYRKARQAEEVRKVVNDYFAAHSQTMAWLLTGAPFG
jgi:hypothetical protein